MTNDKDDDLFDLQSEVQDRITKFGINYSKTPKERFSLGYVNSRLSGLKELWEEFKANHKNIVTQTSAEERKTELYFTQDIFSKVEDIYYEILGRISQKQLSLSQPIERGDQLGQSSGIGEQPNGQPIIQPVTHHIQIPRINVPVFSGSYEEWTSFCDLYTASVHTNNTLDAVHKLQYLKSLLKGDAEHLLKNISITSANYASAWATLKERFENKRAIITITLKRFFAQHKADESANGIRKLLDTTRECIGTLVVQGIDITSWDCILVHIISQNIPAISLNLWEQSIERNALPTYQQLLTFLDNRFRVLEFSDVQLQSNPQPGRSRSKPQTFHTSPSCCRCCQATSHPLKSCAKFINMQASQRLQYVTQAKLCKNCFAYSHSVQTCKSPHSCSVCNERHNSLLHLVTHSAQVISSSDRPPVATAQLPPSVSPAQPPFSTLYSNSSRTNALMSQHIASQSIDCILATALVTVKAFDETIHTFRALLDNGSQETFISKKVLDFLGIKPQPTSIVVNGVGQSHAPKPIGKVRFSFGSHHDLNYSMEVDALVLPTISYALPNKPLVVDRNLLVGLNLADPTYGKPGRIDILLSARVFAAITLPCLRKDTSLATIALNTKLGWVLYGEAIADSSQSNQQSQACFHTSYQDETASVLNKFWQVEEVSVPYSNTKDDDRCEQIFEQSHSRDTNGRYKVFLPFKQEIPSLGSSRERAVTRFKQLEKKLVADPNLHKQYAECLNEYISLGHMRPIPSDEDQHKVILSDHSVTYTSSYLPHHAVLKTDSSTTKLRVVFDASSKSLNGNSLNDVMLTGPVLQDSLFNLLLRWRSHRVVIKADITKMYRQIMVAEEHQPFQRIVWRNHPEDSLQDFELCTVTFGTAAAPYLAIKTLMQLANDEADHFPIGASMLKNDFYVDDLLSGAENVEDAIERQTQVTKILKLGGFEIRKWSSNVHEVTSEMDKEAKDLCSNSDPTLKALGIRWNPQSDTLSIKVNPSQTNVTTKRSLLSEVSKLFDPLGWIAPSIISMKILLQQLWLAGLSWDDPLPTAIQLQWNNFRNQLHIIETININRWMNTTHQSTLQLHGFCDASEKAYAAVIYIRVQTAPNEWAVQLVTAKTRVAPVKTISLPRLELCGAVLLAKLLVLVRATLNISSIHAWSDSEIVLAWLQGHPNRWKTFVSNRVSEIHQLLDAATWHHVRSNDNPADCASRGLTPEQLVNHHLWWHGPGWLSLIDQSWPKKAKTDIPATKLECKSSTQSFVAVQNNSSLDDILSNCGKWSKAVRVTAYIRRWRFKPSSVSAMLTVDEIILATNTVIKHVQASHFPDEYSKLLMKEPISTKSKIASLNPFIDNNLLMRVGGRLINSNLPMETRHPIIIPYKSRLTELIIDDAHRSTSHGGIALMLSFLRVSYWIINARNAIRYRTHKCNVCHKFANTNLNQIMGNLPAPRVNISYPFSHTGLDYAGPISILLRRHPGRPTYTKGYICVLVCLATKAIHLELVGDMSATSFIAAFDRFTARRGLPSDIYSDNGTNFVKAASDIDNDFKHAQKTFPIEAAKRGISQNTQWHFIPPASPHFGGLWEAGVKSTKYHLKRILGNGSCTYEELLTILCQIESCLNSRPLCPISTNPDDFDILTPGHFLIGRPLLARPQPGVLDININRLNNWQRIYQMTQHFWKNWQAEYLSRLQQRPKWVSPTLNVNKGQLVLLKEDNLPPLQWKLGRIVEMYPGTDGLIRVVSIQTPTSILKRPITKICPLPSQ